MLVFLWVFFLKGFIILIAIHPSNWILFMNLISEWILLRLASHIRHGLRLVATDFETRIWTDQSSASLSLSFPVTAVNAFTSWPTWKNTANAQETQKKDAHPKVPCSSRSHNPMVLQMKDPTGHGHGHCHSHKCIHCIVSHHHQWLLSWTQSCL